MGHGLPDTLTLNEKKRPTVALALDGLMKWGATAGIPTGGWVVVGGRLGGAVGAGAGPPDAEVRLVDGALVVPACVVVVFAVVPVGEPYCQHAQAMVPSRSTSVCIVAIGNASASGHVVVSASLAYSTLRTGLPACTKGSRAEHSSYCQHCSFTVPSARGSMSAIRLSPLMSFFKNQAIPRPWMTPAISVMKVSSLAIVKGKPVLSAYVSSRSVSTPSKPSSLHNWKRAVRICPRVNPVGPGSSDHCRMSRYRSSV